MWGVILFVVVVILCFARDRSRFWLASLLLFQFLWMLSSVAYIEANEGLLLVSTWSNATNVGATRALTVLLVAFVAGVFVIPRLAPSDGGSSTVGAGGVRVADPSNAGSGARSAAIARRVILILAIYVLANAVISPNVLTGTGDIRASFYSTSRLPFAAQLNVATPTILAVAGKLQGDAIRRTSKSSSPAWISLALLSASIWLSGVEFSGFIQVLFAFFVSSMVEQGSRVGGAVSRSRLRMRRLVMGAGGVGVAVAVVYKIISLAKTEIYSGVATTGVERFVYRALALQGEVFWRVFSLDADEPHGDQLAAEIDALLLRRPETDSGIYVLMQQIVPKNSSGSAYTLNSGYPAILVYIFGFGLLCVALTFACGLFFGIVLRVLQSELRRNSIVGVAASFGFMFASYLAFSMGGAFYFSSVAGIGSALVYLLVLLCRRFIVFAPPATDEVDEAVPDAAEEAGVESPEVLGRRLG